MADKPKRGPGRPRKHEPKTAKYQIYQDKNGVLTWLGEQTARNATTAANVFLAENEKFVTDDPFVVVPERNISRISAKVDTVKKLTITSS